MKKINNWIYAAGILGIVLVTQALTLMGIQYWGVPTETSLFIIFAILAPLTEEAAKRWSMGFVWALIAAELLSNHNTAAMLGINPGIMLIGMISVKVVFHYYTTYPITMRNYWAGVAVHMILNIPGTYGMTYGRWGISTITIAAWTTLVVVAVAVQIYLGRTTKNHKEVAIYV